MQKLNKSSVYTLCNHILRNRDKVSWVERLKFKNFRRLDRVDLKITSFTSRSWFQGISVSSRRRNLWVIFADCFEALYPNPTTQALQSPTHLGDSSSIFTLPLPELGFNSQSLYPWEKTLTQGSDLFHQILIWILASLRKLSHLRCGQCPFRIGFKLPILFYPVLAIGYRFGVWGGRACWSGLSLQPTRWSCWEHGGLLGRGKICGKYPR